MSVLRLVMVGILLGIGNVLPAYAQQSHWLLGSWDGGRRNVGTSSRTGSDRVLRINSISSDGSTVKAQWVASTGTVSVNLAIAGDGVTFTTPGAQGNPYRLVCKGGQLEDTWTNMGKGNGGSIELTKK